MVRPIVFRDSLDGCRLLSSCDGLSIAGGLDTAIRAQFGQRKRGQCLALVEMDVERPFGLEPRSFVEQLRQRRTV